MRQIGIYSTSSYKMFIKYFKRLTYLTLVLLACLAMASCQEDPVPTPPATHRTVLVYMIADNSLGRGNYDADDIAEMKSAAAAGGLNGGRLLVYRAPAGTEAGKETPVLLEVTETGEVLTLKNYDNSLYSIDVERMQQVTRDVKALAPAPEYGLILWSHGNGWEEGSKSRSFGQEGSSGYTMKISSLAKGLEEFHPGFIYFDCCLMATVEVAYELRHATDAIIASGTELLSEGTRYDYNVPLFFADRFSAEEVARTTFDYFASYSGYYQTCTMSVINTAGLDRLADVTREIMKTGAEPTVSLDYQQSYMVGSASSIYDMQRYIETLDCGSELKDKWHEALKGVVSLALTTPRLFGSFKMTYYCGLGTFILTSAKDADYRGYRNQAWWQDVVSFHPVYNPTAN